MEKRPYSKKELLEGLPLEKLVGYVELLGDNFWTMQNEWLMRVSQRYGLEVANELNYLVWSKLVPVEAYRFKNLVDYGDDKAALQKYSALSIATRARSSGEMAERAQLKRDLLLKLSKEELLRYIDILSQNFWTFQNNWMANINKRYGTLTAVNFDAIVWVKLGPTEVLRFKEFFDFGDDLFALQKYKALSIANGLEGGDELGEVVELTENKFHTRVTRCAMQLNRRRDGFDELPCKHALEPQSKAEAAVLNPRIKVAHVMAPPDPHPEDVWCEVIYTMG